MHGKPASAVDILLLESEACEGRQRSHFELAKTDVLCLVEDSFIFQARLNKLVLAAKQVPLRDPRVDRQLRKDSRLRLCAAVADEHVRLPEPARGDHDVRQMFGEDALRPQVVAVAQEPEAALVEISGLLEITLQMCHQAAQAEDATPAVLIRPIAKEALRIFYVLEGCAEMPSLDQGEGDAEQDLQMIAAARLG